MKLFGLSLGEGNAKLGDVMTFSLPSKSTCPGASPWCLKRCYAHRYEARRPGCRRAYQSNLAFAEDIEAFTERMIGVLPRIMPCFRIHVAGDFHSIGYIQAWRRICRAFPQTRFWTYTRSWIAPELVGPLKRLRSLKNTQVFASTDSDMPLPPEDWRVAFVSGDPRAKGDPCHKQSGKASSCLECGYCFRREKGDVVFNVR